MERIVWYRRRTDLVACGVAVAVCAAAGVYLATDSSRAGQGGPSAAVVSAPGSQPLAPTTPPVRICGNTALLDGPADPPAGSIPVGTSQNLNNVTDQHPPGTTFWLAPGIHRLGTGKFSQVVPKAGDTYLGAPGAVLDGQLRNRYAFTGNAANVTVKYLTVQNFGPPRSNNDAGVVNHDAATGWVIERNTVSHNAGAGVMVGTRNLVRDNCLAGNGQYGFSAYNPHNVADITIEDNEIAHNNTDNWEKLKKGCGCSGGGKFWMVDGAVVRNNWVHDNEGAGLWADTNNTGFTFEGNYIADNDAEGIVYETSYNALIRGNAFVRNGHAKGQTSHGFPTGAVYISESGSDPRVAGMHKQHFEISNNVFLDNWSGVILWENADRFTGSPANTSTNASTLVNPHVISASSCNEANIKDAPYLDDCRWKTQEVHVHDNLFTMDPARLGTTCAARTGCGYNGLFSNWGTYPRWSPYQRKTIEDWITFKQGNLFYRNTYSGPWHFVVHNQGMTVNWATWQGAPYNQDSRSVVKVARTTRER